MMNLELEISENKPLNGLSSNEEETLIAVQDNEGTSYMHLIIPRIFNIIF